MLNTLILYRSKSAVLKQIAGIDVKLGSISLKNSPYASDNIVILVGLTGKSEDRQFSP